jgi:hypothetical protein
MRSPSRRASALATCALLSILAIPGVTLVACRSIREIEPEEYAVYSAFISNDYLRQDTAPKFTLSGVEVRAFLFDRIEEVVIYRATSPTPDYYVPRGDRRQGIPVTSDWQFAHEAFDDYLVKNGAPSLLSNKLVVPVPYSFVTEQEERAQVSQAALNEISGFAARHPKALGTIYLSRVGFDRARRIAVLLVNQADIYGAMGSTRRHERVFQFAREGGRWNIQKVHDPYALPDRHPYALPDRPAPMVVDLAQCRSDRRSIGGTWLGSETVEVTGREQSDCVIRHSQEAGDSACYVPAGLGQLTITVATRSDKDSVLVYSQNVARFCHVVERTPNPVPGGGLPASLPHR